MLDLFTLFVLLVLECDKSIKFSLLIVDLLQYLLVAVEDIS